MTTAKNKVYTKALIETMKDNLDIREIKLSTRVFGEQYESGYKDVDDIDLSGLSTNEILDKLVDGNNQFVFKGRTDRGIHKGSDSNTILGTLFVSTPNDDSFFDDDEDDEYVRNPYLVSIRTNMLGDFVDAHVPYIAIQNAEKSIGNDIEQTSYSPEQLESIKHVINKFRKENIDMIYLNRYVSDLTVRDMGYVSTDDIVKLINFKDKKDRIELKEMMSTKLSDGTVMNHYGMSSNRIGHLYFNQNTESTKPSDLVELRTPNCHIEDYDKVDKEKPEYKRAAELLKQCDKELGYSSNDNTLEM